LSGNDPPKKHPCADCRFCQWCSDERCRLCQNRNCCRRQLSLAEQIELYERLNRNRKNNQKTSSEATGRGHPVIQRKNWLRTGRPTRSAPTFPATSITLMIRSVQAPAASPRKVPGHHALTTAGQAAALLTIIRSDSGVRSKSATNAVSVNFYQRPPLWPQPLIPQRQVRYLQCRLKRRRCRPRQSFY